MVQGLGLEAQGSRCEALDLPAALGVHCRVEHSASASGYNVGSSLMSDLNQG